MAARWNVDRVRSLDAVDEVRDARKRFLLPEGIIYLNGNSLGPLGVDVSERVRRTVEDEWGVVLGAGWSKCGWMEAPQRVGDRIAPLIGALSGEVVVADTTSIALAKLVGAALRARPARRVVVSSTDNFPSDLFSAAAAAHLAGAELRVVDRAELLSALGPDVAVCCLTQVDFRTGELHDVSKLTAATHEAGALSLWDLCHSAGVVPVDCEENGIDLAVGCTYKYLNGGPGSPSFMYVRRNLQDQLENPLPGWLGHDTPFGFELEWRPASGIARFVTSTPPVVALAALDAALDAFDGLTIGQLREKSETLTQLFIDAVLDAQLPALEVVSPLSAASRGSQVSLRHPRASELIGAFAARGVIGDFRAPNLCRFGFSPMMLSYEEAYGAARIIVDVVGSLDG